MSEQFARVDDTAARRLAQTEFDHPVAVEAGAGTGKTTVLVARILSWCLGHGWQPAVDRLRAAGADDLGADEIAAEVLDGLLAITFTEAAAAQMGRRVAEALNQLGTDPAAEVVGFDKDLLPENDRETLQRRARALTGALDHLAVRTIHAHCWHLLATHPMALGLSPDLEIDADGRKLEEVVREIVETATKQAYVQGPGQPLTALAIRGIDPQRVAAALVELARDGFPAAALHDDPIGTDRRQEVVRELDGCLAVLERLSAPLAEQKRSAKDRETTAAIVETRARLDDCPEGLTRDALIGLLDRLRQIWDDGCQKRLGQWAKGDFTQTAKRELGEDRHLLVRPAAQLSARLRLYHRLDVELLDAGRRALGPLLHEVENEMRTRGLLTFSSLLTEAWRLLHDHQPVLRSERRRLHQLLVDEFQDTDRRQCDLVRLLALGGDPESRPGLFVVGDPKQSIYGWRDADLEAYENFLDDLHAARGVTVALDRNFRSVPMVLAEVDRAISPIMLAEPGLQPQFASLVPRQDLDPGSGFGHADRRPIESWVAWGPDGPATRADEAAQIEAEAIAEDIAMLHAEAGEAWSEFGLLLRSTTRLETYLESFRRHRVPFVVTSDKQYFRRREIIEAAALVRTILVPVDHLALVTFLRSATVGVPDAALLPLWRQRFPELVTRLQGPDSTELAELQTIVESVGASLPQEVPGLGEIHGWESSTVAALENLAHLRQAFTVEPADRFVNLLRRRFLFDVTEASRHLGSYRLANLDRFFRELEQALENRQGDIQAILRALRRGVAEAEEVEQALPEGATEEAVQVMTIHGAKGLEFGHVYLPQLHAKGRGNRTPEIQADRRWVAGQPADYVLFGSPTPGFHRIEERTADVERTEQIRTLYVAMTRARERLVLLGNWPQSPQPVPVDKRTTYLDLLRSREGLPDAFDEVRAECVEAEKPFCDVGGIRWRFLDLDRQARRRPPSQPTRSSLPTLKSAKHQAARLGRLQQAAAGHMRRPMSAAASAEAAARLIRLDHDDLAGGDVSPSREIALPVGSAFHRLMEGWRLAADPIAELERQGDRQRRWLSATLASDQVVPALERFDQLLARFRRGQFVERFSGLAGFDVAREVPIVAAPGASDTDPVGFLSGFIDLLYRDPEIDQWIIVDYKTDRLEDADEIARRAAAYTLQEAVYARALGESLALDKAPLTELWFIWPDVLWPETGSS